MVSQKENRLDFAEITDTGKIFLAKLSEGLLGRENSCLLGALLVSKFQQLAMSRQAKQVAARKPFWIYADEAANFMTPSMAEILSGARKYRIGLTLAHHELHQLKADPKVESAVLTHPFTRIVFRVGDDDARKLAEGFSSFEARDLRNLETGQAVVRVERSDFDFNLTVALPTDPPPVEAAQRRQAVIAASRVKYAAPRAEVEAALRKELGIGAPEPSGREVKQQTNPTDEQTAPLSSQPTVSAERVAPPQYKELGKGGEQHQAIQQRLKRAAEELGFRATIEKPILEGQGSVDLLLDRVDTVIACEVSVTNRIDYEAHNVAKCLKAGLACVAVVCADKGRVARIKTAVETRLGPEVSRQVVYFLPDQFIDHLKSLAPPAPPPSPPAEIRGGRKVQRKYVEITPEERKAREDAALKLITEDMRKKRK
jgi:hypothetical protein